MSGLIAQGERLVTLGLPDRAGVSAATFIEQVAALRSTGDAPLLVVHPDLVPPSRLAGLLEHSGKPGFVVVDMDDLDDFVPIEGAAPPSGPVYAVYGIERGDDLRNWSPAEALPELSARGRRPLTVNEGISWLLQQPEQLEPGFCFMTIGSRKPKARGGLDARTPAIWISRGTGRDGKERAGAPKVGWCWHNNRHTWLGIASCVQEENDPGRQAT